jgi:DNA-binding NtrC family response regulator
MQDQVKLLRALQEHRIERVGGTKEISVDVRIVSATNRILRDEVESKNFREDLFFRVAVIIFTVSPLRKRLEDILPLARHFLALHGERLSRQAPSLTPEAEAALLRYHWPGNVRELENVIERALAFGEGEKIDVESLGFEAGSSFQSTSQGPEGSNALTPAIVRLDDLGLPEKREMILQALRENFGIRGKTAKSLGISRYQLYRLMEDLGISDEIKGK